MVELRDYVTFIRQETAAKAGLIPFLVFVIANNKPLKEFAVPLMCELAGKTR